MVVKTEICAYTEYKIYPGRGQKCVGKDAKTSFFLTAKATALYHQKIKPVKLTWTQAWRRMHKKGKIDSSGRRKNKKTTKVQKAIAGMSLEDLKRKKAAISTMRSKAVEEAKAEASKRSTKKKSGGATGAQPKQAKNVVPQKQQNKAGQRQQKTRRT